MKTMNFLVLLIALSMAFSALAMEATITTPSGSQLIGIGDDGALPPFDVYSWGFAAYDRGGNGSLDLLLDLGVAENVSVLEFINADVSSNLAISNVDIFVASTEGDAGFDPTVYANYDVKVYDADSGIPPYDIGAKVIRTADINDCSNQYFLLHITSTYDGASSPCFFYDIRKGTVGFPVTAGKFFTIADDAPLGNVYVDPNFYALYDSGNGSVDMVLDLGLNTFVSAIELVNRIDDSTNYSIALVDIYVASDEAAVDFDPTDVNDYTVKVFGNGTFEPGNILAGAVRIADINDCERRYFLIHITDTWEEFPAIFSDLNISSGGFPVCGGRIFGIGDDILQSLCAPVQSTYDTFSFYNVDGNDTLQLVLDTGSVQYIEELRLINSEYDTILQLGEVEILVAPDESAPGFDYLDASSYTEMVLDGSFLPNVKDPLTERIADIDDVHKRYFLITIKTFLSGNVAPGTNALFDDICYVDNPIDDCNSVNKFGLTLAVDLNQDCKVGIADMDIFAEQWLDCTNPAGEDCIKTLSAIPTYAIAKVPTGGIIVDGSLSDWPSDSEWIPLDERYSGDSSWDVTEAKFSLRWSDANDKVYLAVVVNDPDRTFAEYNTASDFLEIYSQGDVAGGTGWGIAGTQDYDVAQQYILGANGSGGQWLTWADVMQDVEADAEFESTVVVDGNVITYEIGLKQFNNYGGISGDATEITALESGIYVGLDVIVNTVFSGGSSMISENLFTGKYNDAAQFQQYELVDVLPQQYCGDWGYVSGDFDKNCQVNLEDFARFALQWLMCNDPQDITCTPNW